MVSFNPVCYLPGAVSKLVPSIASCSPPPSFLKSTYDTITSPFGSTYTALKAAMDALLSLPLLSFLLIPTMTSYSTSLNLLFFYLTWSTLVLSHPPLRVEIVASLAIKFIFFILPSSFFLLFDVLFPGISVSFKSLGSAALPFRDLSRRRVPRYLKILGWSLANIVIAIALQAGIEYTLVNVFDRKPALKVTTSLPLPWGILKDLLRGFLFRDLSSFLIHRYMLHNPKANALTRDLTYLHTSWYHDQIRAPFPLSPTYDHPIVFLLRVFIPAYLPAYLWRFHLLTYMLFLMLISLEETFTHSGYTSIPTNFVLGGVARRNDLHCLSGGQGNFGAWGVCDWIVGTNLGGDLAEELLMEIEETQIQDRVQRRVLSGVRRVRAANGGAGVKATAANALGLSDLLGDDKEGKTRTKKSRGKTATRVQSSSGSGSAGASRATRRRPTRRRGDDDEDSDYEI